MANRFYEITSPHATPLEILIVADQERFGKEDQSEVDDATIRSENSSIAV